MREGSRNSVDDVELSQAFVARGDDRYELAGVDDVTNFCNIFRGRLRKVSTAQFGVVILPPLSNSATLKDVAQNLISFRAHILFQQHSMLKQRVELGCFAVQHASRMKEKFISRETSIQRIIANRWHLMIITAKHDCWNRSVFTGHCCCIGQTTRDDPQHFQIDHAAFVDEEQFDTLPHQILVMGKLLDLLGSITVHLQLRVNGGAVANVLCCCSSGGREDNCVWPTPCSGKRGNTIDDMRFATPTTTHQEQTKKIAGGERRALDVSFERLQQSVRHEQKSVVLLGVEPTDG